MKITSWLLGICLVLVVLFMGRSIFVPLLYGIMIAMVAYPLCARLEKRKIRRGPAVAISLILVLLVCTTVLFLLFLEAAEVYRKMPLLMETIQTAIPGIQAWIADTFGWSEETQLTWLNNSIENFFGELSVILNKTLTATMSLLFNIVIIPVFAALILYNREQYSTALGSMMSTSVRPELPGILKEAINTFYSYIIGMLKVYIIVGILNSAGLMALGIENAWLYGMIAAFMTIIPIVGIMISAVIPISIAWVTKDSAWYALGVVGVFSVVQYLEANIIFPKVVGTQLNLNTLATLLLILVGGLLWGVGGMILFPPFMAIVKIVSKEIPGWESINLFLSNKS